MAPRKGTSERGKGLSGVPEFRRGRQGSDGEVPAYWTPTGLPVYLPSTPIHPSVALGTLGYPLSAFVLLPVPITGRHKAGPHSLVSLCIPGTYSCGNSLDTNETHKVLPSPPF